MAHTLVPVPGAQLEVLEHGSGEPLVLIQTALTADELLPIAGSPALAAYRRIVYHRRGYAGSSGVSGRGSIVRDAADCAELLAALGVERAHVVGLSYSGAVAMQLAADKPELCRSVVLIEPPPVHVPSAAEFRAVNERLFRTSQKDGPAAALDEFMTMLVGADWRRASEEQLPGSAQQMDQDRLTFFDTDLPALLDWDFGAEKASGITCPVLHVGGTDSGPWFAEVRELVLRWFPQAEDVRIDGADHSLALTHSTEVAEAIAGFLERHPM